VPDPTERNLKTVIEYDGTAYVGWERQKNGLGIQEVLEEAVHTITRERVVVEGSGRTDAGVHALGQVASFRVESDIHVEKLRLGLNAVLPPDIAVLSIEEADAGFHARRSAKNKQYRYTILNAPARRPHARLVSYHFPQPLDHEAMAEAARCFVGEHDFSAFAREADQKKTCVRTILEAQVVRDGEFLHVDVVGTGFLYNMVRIITGTLIEVGVGKRDAGTVPALLQSKRREETGYTVPAHGLALVQVGY
jgi:tRNA pseudouridine38-40 synthase